MFISNFTRKCLPVDDKRLLALFSLHTYLITYLLFTNLLTDATAWKRFCGRPSRANLEC